MHTHFLFHFNLRIPPHTIQIVVRNCRSKKFLLYGLLEQVETSFVLFGIRKSDVVLNCKPQNSSFKLKWKNEIVAKLSRKHEKRIYKISHITKFSLQSFSFFERNLLS